MARTLLAKRIEDTCAEAVESRRRGNCHFCGEQTSLDFQGYLNGAVETGERVVSEILGDLKHA